METKEFKALLQQNFEKRSKNAEKIFEVQLDKDELWNLYLDSFPAGTNPVLHVRREYDCSSCRQFVKNVGNVVFIIDNQVVTIWDFETNDAKYQPVIDALSQFVRSRPITDVFISKQAKMGTDKNYGEFEGNVQTFEHLYLELPKKYVVKSASSEAEIRGELRDVRNVFKRSLDEITEDSVLTVLELTSQGSLYKGEEWKHTLSEFLKFKKVYDKLQTEDEKANFAWEQSITVGAVVGKIKNHSMGTLLVNISKEMDLDEAVRKYESIVAPHNYKRPKAIFSKKMLEDAKKKMEELDYLDALNRRHASLDDITIDNILFSNKDAAKRIQGAADIFDSMAREVSTSPKQFSKVEEISISAFIENILPLSREVEVYFENKHAPNMVSLIAPVNKSARSMFKWNNAISLAYTGNMADSSMKENVKAAGGRVDGVLRFSIQWNSDEYNPNDFDAHCVEPGDYHIHYVNKQQLSPTGGMLDVDIISPIKGKPAVENITWANTTKMKKGVYKFFVKNYAHKGGRSGFEAEVEINGQIHTFEYDKELRTGEMIQVAEVTFDGTNFTIKELLPSTVSSKEIWNLQTNQFVPVSVICYSPNYWDEQDGIGHKHYMFMLKDCINSEEPNGFYNEFLNEELMPHKRVCEALGSKMAVQKVDDQLSGLGFSSTKRNDLIVKVKGQSERVLKIKF